MANGVPSEIDFVMKNWSLKDVMLELGLREYHTWQSETESKYK